MKAHGGAPTLRATSSRSRGSSGGRIRRRSESTSSTPRDPWMPEDNHPGGTGHSSSSFDDDASFYEKPSLLSALYSKGKGKGTGGQDASEPTSEAASSQGKHKSKHTIWTVANPLHAKRNKRRNFVTNATRALWALLGLTVLWEIWGVYHAVWTEDDATAAGAAGGVRRHPLSSQFGDQLKPGGGIGQGQVAKKAGAPGMRAGVNNNNNNKDPLADVDWTGKQPQQQQQQQQTVVGAAPGMPLPNNGRGGISTAGNNNANNMNSMFNPNNPGAAVGGNGASTTTRAVGPDAVKVTTRTTSKNDLLTSAGLVGPGAADKSNGAVQSLEEKIAQLESKLTSLLDPKTNNDGNEQKLKMLEGKLSSLLQQEKEAAAGVGPKSKDSNNNNKQSDPNTQEQDFSERLSCDADGASAAEELVYWKYSPRDASFLSPLHPDNVQAGGKRARILTKRFLSFEIDQNAGFNTARRQFETMLVLAHAMGRVLVLPPKWAVWPSKNVNDASSFDDYFDLDGLTKQYAGVEILTMEAFLTQEGLTGELRQQGSGDAGSIAAYPPNGKTDWTGDPNVKALWSYLEFVSMVPTWDLGKCVAAFPASLEEGPESGNQGLLDVMDRILRLKDGRRKPKPQHFQGKPTPVNAPTIERMREVMAEREKLCTYDEPMRQAKVVHFPVGSSSRGHFYSSVFFEDYAHDVWAKRFIRNLRYKDEIQCAAARVIAAMRTKSVLHSKEKNGNGADSGDEIGADAAETNGKYDALHLRRTNFRELHPDAVLPPEDIGVVVREKMTQKGGTLYVATDSRGDEEALLSYIDDEVQVLSLIDFGKELQGLDPKFYAMVDQIVSSRGETFIGTYYSAFSGYINRLRGYHSAAAKSDGYRDGVINSLYMAPKAKQSDMRLYKAVRAPFIDREYPVAWRDIEIGA